MSPAPARSAAELAPGAVVARRVTFTEAMVAGFAALVDDSAPVHVDAAFARASGFSGRIVHGFLLGSVFSGMLGQELPGPYSVINTVNLKMRRPVAQGETVDYEVRVEQVSEAVGAVVLTLLARNAAGETVLSGKATCSFPRRSRP